MFTQSPLDDSILRSRIELTGERLECHQTISPVLLNGLMLSVADRSHARLALRYLTNQTDAVLLLSEQKSIVDIAKVDDHSVAVLMNEEVNHGLQHSRSVVLLRFDAEFKAEIIPVDLGKDLQQVFTMGRTQELVTLHQGFEDNVMLEAYDFDDINEGIVQEVAQWKRWDLSDVKHPMLKSIMKMPADKNLDHHQVLLHASSNHIYVRIHANWYLWNTEQMVCQPDKLKLASTVMNLRELPILETIVTFKKFGTVQFFDLDLKATAPFLDLPSTGELDSSPGARVTPDGKHVLIWRAHTDTRLSLLDVKARKIVETIDLSVLDTVGPQQITFVTNPTSDGQVGVVIESKEAYHRNPMFVPLSLSAFQVLLKKRYESQEEKVTGFSMFQRGTEEKPLKEEEKPAPSMMLAMN